MFKILYIILSLLKITKLKILFVHTHFRHGARGSSKGGFSGIGKDYLGINWETNGELTNVGMRGEYLLGYYTKMKYKNFLSEKFDPREILIYSTFIKRAIHSGYSYVHGLYPPLNKENYLNQYQINNSFPPGNVNDNLIKENLKLGNFALDKGLNVIPVKVFNMKDHEFLLFDVASLSDCQPIYELRKIEKKNKELIDFTNYFKEKYGKNLENFFKKENTDFKWEFLNIQDLCDNFVSDKTNGEDLSEFQKITKINFTEFEKDCHDEFAINFLNYQFSNKDILFMSQTPVMKNLINYMKNRIYIEENNLNDLNYSSPKLVVYASHDSTMSGVMIWMKEIFGSKYVEPTFSSSIFFELHKNDNLNELKGNYEDYYIKFFANSEELINLNFKFFIEKAEEYLWSDKQIEKYCRFNIVNIDIKMKKIKIYLFILFGLFVLLILMIFFSKDILFYKKEKINDEGKELEDILIKEENKE